MSRTAFISGPLDATPDYFSQYYASRIQVAIEQGDSFILGDSRGIDSMALMYLVSLGAGPKSTVLTLPNNFVSFTDKWLKYGVTVRPLEPQRAMTVNQLHTLRDELCTKNSHYDILRYRSVEECRALYGDKYRERVSGTEWNERRRTKGIGLK